MEGTQRVEVDAAEDVRHRDQRDRGVERRQQDRQRRVGERDPLVAVVAVGCRAVGVRPASIHILHRQPVQFACLSALWLRSCPHRPGTTDDRRRRARQRAAGRPRPADPPPARRAPLPALPGRRPRPPRPRGPAAASATSPPPSGCGRSRWRRPSATSRPTAWSSAAPTPRRPPRPGQPHRRRAGGARSRPPRPRGLAGRRDRGAAGPIATTLERAVELLAAESPAAAGLTLESRGEAVPTGADLAAAGAEAALAALGLGQRRRLDRRRRVATGIRTSWAMRSPGAIRKVSAGSLFSSSTRSSPR